MRPEKFKFLWKFLLAYTWFVILWGAFVRASGSGDGCGKNWPTCHGQLIPKNSDIQTWIEYIHRSTSGLYGIYVLVLVVLAWRFFTPLFKVKSAQGEQFQAKKFWRSTHFLLPLGVLFFTITEALIGAQLVLSGLVGSNESWARALVMVIHLVNTFFLTGCIVGTISLILPPRPSEKAARWNYAFFTLNALGLFAVASLGAIAALGDTLYPSETLRDGIQKDFAENAHFLIKLRVWHPIIAVLVTWSVSTMAFQNIEKPYAKHLLFWMCSTLFIGLINLFLLAPIALQLTHLLWAQILWAQFCLFGFKNIHS
ncbi:MAG: COX15/CtaA family protein [Bdellovibrionaceae bacterium]|nr:COX15/CtaA family protein [Pseudobdellovibrionaceae bacterium]